MAVSTTYHYNIECLHVTLLYKFNDKGETIYKCYKFDSADEKSMLTILVSDKFLSDFSTYYTILNKTE